MTVLQQAFGTASLTPNQWLLCLGMGASVLVAEEIVKAVRRALVSRG